MLGRKKAVSQQQSRGMPSRSVLSLMLGLRVRVVAYKGVGRYLFSLCPGPLPRVYDTPW